MMSVVGERANDTLMDDLPNLKIEIENDLDQKMDTDDEGGSGGKPGNVSSTEEGEVSDDDEEVNYLLLGQKNQATILNAHTVPTGRSILQYDTKEYGELQNKNAVQNPKGAFVTGVNVFSPEEQAKLDKRALRFGIEAVEGKVLTEKLLKKLYKSMGVKPTDKDIRLEALHMRGTKGMKPPDVFNYFKDYGPASLEWNTENSCNVVWLDEVSAARALLGLSVHISGQTAPARAVSRRGSAETDSDVDMDQPSVPAGNGTPADDEENLSEDSDAVTAEELGMDLPPGRWRRGAPHPISPCILLRFATVNDKFVPKAHLPNNQFGAGYKGLISESRKRRMQQALPNPILFEDIGDEFIPKPAADDTDSANPWGALAKTWGRFDKVRKPRPPSPVIERLIPMPTRMTPPPSPPVFSSQRAKLVPRTRLRRERDAESRKEVTKASGEEGSSDTEEWSRRSKMPRMRMHADDEEKKIEKRLKRRHRDRSLSVSPARVSDLRRKLKPSVEVKVEAESSSSSSSSSEEEESGEGEAEEGEAEDEVPDLRVAVPADTSPSRETKPVIRQSLFTTGNIKSVLRGARGYSENDEDDEDEESDHSEKVRSSRRHRSRSKERRKHHRKHKKESSHHKSRRKEEDSDSEEDGGKIKSTIRRRSPERNRRSPESRERRSPRRDRRRKEDDHRRSENSRRLDRRHDESSKSSRDLRSKISHRSKGYDLDNEFRSKSPLQIELDNDYYKGSESE